MLAIGRTNILEYEQSFTLMLTMIFYQLNNSAKHKMQSEELLLLFTQFFIKFQQDQGLQFFISRFSIVLSILKIYFAFYCIIVPLLYINYILHTYVYMYTYIYIYIYIYLVLYIYNIYIYIQPKKSGHCSPCLARLNNLCCKQVSK